MLSLSASSSCSDRLVSGATVLDATEFAAATENIKAKFLHVRLGRYSATQLLKAPSAE